MRRMGGVVMVLWIMSTIVSIAADPAVLIPRVPSNQIQEARG